MVTLPFESIFGSGLLASVCFLSCYGIFELCIGVVSVVSYGDYSDCWHLKKEWLCSPCCG
jgi:hypothetical protein